MPVAKPNPAPDIEAYCRLLKAWIVSVPQNTTCKPLYYIGSKMSNMNRGIVKAGHKNWLAALCLILPGQILDSLPQREHFDVTLTITPTRLENNVDLRVGYRAVSAEKNLHTTNRIIVEAELAPHEVELTDVVAMRGLKIDVTGSTNRRVRVKMDGVVARTINLGNNFAKDEAK